MFRSALIKLTLIYLIVIMVISFSFSLNLYRISASEIDYSLGRQQMMFEKGGMMLPATDGSPRLTLRSRQLAEGQSRVFWQLVYTNIFILISGGGVSYLLARLTLKPIEESHEAQARFTADASHELRSPLAAMKAEIEVALRDPNLTREEAIHGLRSNLEEVDRLKALSDALLELSRSTEDFVLTKVSVGGAVQMAINNIQKQTGSDNSEIIVEVPEKLTVSANSDSLVELFTILLDNALKYSHELRVITVVARRVGKHVEIAITDNGMGISEEDLPHIFERFYRSEPSRSKNKIEGYGLGLSIAEKIVKKNNGRIEVASKPKLGTTFKVFLSLG